MSQEEEVKRLLLNIIRTGILRIRAFAWDHHDDRRCAVEADHIHNLPALVQNPRLERLIYYWEIERPTFTKSVPDSDDFDPDWLRLGELIAELRAEANGSNTA